jgi:hypothetical protein
MPAPDDAQGLQTDLLKARAFAEKMRRILDESSVCSQCSTALQQQTTEEAAADQVCETQSSHTLTKNQFLVHLFDDLLDRDCSTEAMLRYILYSLPGLDMERKQEILATGPTMSRISTSNSTETYVYSKLVQYKCSKAYAEMKGAVTYPELRPNKWSTQQSGFEKMACTEDVAAQCITLHPKHHVDLT